MLSHFPQLNGHEVTDEGKEYLYSETGNITGNNRIRPQSEYVKKDNIDLESNNH